MPYTLQCNVVGLCLLLCRCVIKCLSSENADFRRLYNFQICACYHVFVGQLTYFFFRVIFTVFIARKWYIVKSVFTRVSTRVSTVIYSQIFTKCLNYANLFLFQFYINTVARKSFNRILEFKKNLHHTFLSNLYNSCGLSYLVDT